MKTYKCGINPESNVHLVYRGGCEKPLTIEDAYRCTGCNQRFHKDCILEHFKQEKDHDWGRAVERAAVIAEVEQALDGLDCGFCNYGDEVELRLSSLLTKKKEDNHAE